jgi:uncharacterized protein
MHFSARRLFLLLIAIVGVNTMLWLDSLDTYLGVQYHVELSDYLNDGLYLPSRSMQRLFAEKETPHWSDKAALQKPAPKDHPAVVTPPLAASPAQETSAKAETPTLAAEQATDETVSEHPRVLFAGDSMMQGLAPFVIASLRKSYPNALFSDQSKQSTGLTVRRYFDWPARIKNEVIKQNFDTVVIFLGPNDPWDMYDAGKHYIFPSDEWVEKYRSRVEEVLAFSKDHKVTVVWIGLPNMHNERIKKGAEVENRVFREETQRYGFNYLATEPILGKLDEPYQKHVEDPVKGKIVVRADDGIHFTPAGLRLISVALTDLLKTKLK